ncbi:MAG: winged helix-turn-helix transcriptional regulator [Solirubrobacteraceae bacterium]
MRSSLGDPLYGESAASVRLTLLGERVDRRLEARLPRGPRLIMSALRDAGSLSTDEVAETIGISRPTAASHLRVLRDAGLIVWTGKSAKDPRASWSLPES